MNLDEEFINISKEEKFNKKFFDLQKEMKIDCVEEFSLSENLMNENNIRLK